MSDKALVATGDQQLALSDASLVASWLEWLAAADGASPATITAYRRSLDAFTTWLRESGSAGLVTPQTIVTYKGHLQEAYAPQTVNLRLSAVRSFYRYLVATDQAPLNPASQIKGAKRRRSRSHKRDALTNGEVVSVLDTCEDTPAGQRDRAALTAMAFCGLRSIEIQRASVSDLHTRQGRLVLEVQGKGSTEPDRIAVIPRAQEHVVRAWATARQGLPGTALFCSVAPQNAGERLSTRRIRGMVKARYHLAGVVGAHKTTHSLRHSAITNAIRNGAQPLQVRAMAGHSSFDTTLVYYHETERTESPAEDLISYA